MNQTEEMEEVVITRPCKICIGYGYTCDYSCQEECNHRRNTGCGCQFGEVEVVIKIPKDIVAKYMNDY